ncbi:hypothetical protein [Commensalibacter papalotli (ex Botero et al. 2024)]|uniref:Uncharacterized protein n=1 Tax=Commensalibacter papalotli (ex Botero et al. 2024) TaxID=2972766 RepID=A0ABM9HJ11_9PROT|nr:hypothetical protein [Commensalibacter papalotli (ex Botero et al. 2024)]CAI3925586.1 unnamed protein product [Commensalibacter papalotli (ex Botero et al. 2024)]CAI3926499.1 unnamed protein product [Commensalibacter papalotli (ex Botero et al. 2024)]
MKKIKCLFVLAILVTPLLGCQIDQNSNSYDKPTSHSVALNYLFVHGMCVGYLQNSSITKEQFLALAQLDQQAKLSVVKALTHSNSANLEQAQYLMKQIIAFISSDKQDH